MTLPSCYQRPPSRGGKMHAQSIWGRSGGDSDRNTPFPSRTFPADPLRHDGAINPTGHLLRSSVLACWCLTSGRWRQHFPPPRRCGLGRGTTRALVQLQRPISPRPRDRGDVCFVSCPLSRSLIARRRNQNKRPVRASALAGFTVMPGPQIDRRWLAPAVLAPQRR